MNPDEAKSHSQDLVEMWGDFIDWEKRRAGENNFLLKCLSDNQATKIFDASLGDGCDSIFLIQNTMQVTSNEIDKIFCEKATENAQKHGVKLNITTYDWRNLSSEIGQKKFDAVTCLGNSLTYLFEEKDRLETLKNFYEILKTSGVLIIDERNYQYILDDRAEILKGNFRYSNKYVYCGEKVHAFPVEITDNKVVMEYTEIRTNQKGRLELYPFKQGELKNLLIKAGFNQITQYSDFQSGYDDKADFYQYVCVK